MWWKTFLRFKLRNEQRKNVSLKREKRFFGYVEKKKKRLSNANIGLEGNIKMLN